MARRARDGRSRTSAGKHVDARPRARDSLRVTIPPDPYWLTVRNASDAGRACRDYAVYDEAGAPVANAHAFPWRREIRVLCASAPAPVVVLRRRRSFPISGKVDVLDGSGARLGVLGRDGRCRDARGHALGRFRDARSVRARTAQSLIAGALDVAVGNDASMISGPTALAWLVDGRAAGSLHRAPLPFEDPAEAAAPDAPVRRWLPYAIAKRLERGRTRAWRFEREPPSSPDDPRLVLAAVLFAIELSHW